MERQRAIGVDVGGTKVLAGLVDCAGQVVRRAQRPTPLESQQALLEAIAALVEELRDEAVAAVGLGVPSTIDQRQGRAVFSVHVPLRDLSLRDWARQRFGLPAAVDNDANAAALAEWKTGAGRGTQHMVMLTLGTGVGGGLILGGRLYRGAVGAGAELGHMVLEYGGPPCQGACTGHGHFETLVSGTAASALARRLLGPEADARALVAAARRGEKEALAAMDALGSRLGAAIASLVNIFNPEAVVVGGGFGEAFDLLVDAARREVAREALPPGRDLVRILQAELGEEAGMIGAALIGLEALDGL
jgi:glucokinase